MFSFVSIVEAHVNPRCRRRKTEEKLRNQRRNANFGSAIIEASTFSPAQGVSSLLFLWCVVVGHTCRTIININILSGGIKIDEKRLLSLKTLLLCKPRLHRCPRVTKKVRLRGDHRNNKEIDRICNDFSCWSRLASRHCATFSPIAFLMIFHFCQITSPAVLGRLGPCKPLQAIVSQRERPSHLAETRHQPSFQTFSPHLSTFLFTHL